MRSFGELEARIMQVVWRRGAPSTVHQILEELEVDREVAYTTAITVIERLRTKGWLDRHREGRSYRYRATRSEGDYAASLMGQALDEASDRTAALIRFSDQLSPAEIAALRTALDDPQPRATHDPGTVVTSNKDKSGQGSRDHADGTTTSRGDRP